MFSNIYDVLRVEHNTCTWAIPLFNYIGIENMSRGAGGWNKIEACPEGLSPGGGGGGRDIRYNISVSSSVLLYIVPRLQLLWLNNGIALSMLTAKELQPS